VTAEYWTKALENLEKLQPHQDPAFTNGEAMEQFRLLESECTAIFNKPPPKPKVEEKPAEEKAAETKPEEEKPAEDVPMDNEPPVSADDLS